MFNKYRKLCKIKILRKNNLRKTSGIPPLTALVPSSTAFSLKCKILEKMLVFLDIQHYENITFKVRNKCYRIHLLSCNDRHLPNLILYNYITHIIFLCKELPTSSQELLTAIFLYRTYDYTHTCIAFNNTTTRNISNKLITHKFL